MDKCTKGNIKTIEKKVMEDLFGKMEWSMKESLPTITGTILFNFRNGIGRLIDEYNR